MVYANGHGHAPQDILDAMGDKAQHFTSIVASVGAMVAPVIQGNPTVVPNPVSVEPESPKTTKRA